MRLIKRIMLPSAFVFNVFNAFKVGHNPNLEGKREQGKIYREEEDLRSQIQKSKFVAYENRLYHRMLT